jgi:SAM-dependent methyltransferase
MGPMDEYFDANRRNWNDRAVIHARSDMYALHRFVDDPEAIGGTVAFDRGYLGDLAGASVVHLQCHIGTDTISLARLGAEVTGLDLSEASIAEAEKLFAATNTPGRFVIANVYDAVEALGTTYDLVYTGVGAINWLPSIRRWAEVVASLLNPGGRLYIREGHPMASTLDDERGDDALVVKYPYFETEEPMVWDEQATYTDGDTSGITSTRQYEWAHGLGETVMAVVDAGLVLDGLYEHRSIPWKMLPHMIAEGRNFLLPAHQRDLVPLMFSLLASKPA